LNFEGKIIQINLVKKNLVFEKCTFKKITTDCFF